MLDNIDLQLLAELQVNADRTNVELGRVVELSPAATLHRVRRLKESGVLRRITAELDRSAVGLPLEAYVLVTLTRADERTSRTFERELGALPQVIAADWVAGETDLVLQVVAKNVPDLQHVLVRLANRGGQRVITLLKTEEAKPRSPLPLPAPASSGSRRPR